MQTAQKSMSIKHDPRREWNSPQTRDFKRLASQLGAKVYAATSRPNKQGEYILFLNPDPWILPNKRRAFIEACVKRNKSGNGTQAIILIDTKEADNAIQDGIAGTIAHEIGHHIFMVVNGRKNNWDKERSPKQTVLAAFHREGFRASPETEEEIVAETLGQYLRGHKLNPVLLSKVKETLSINRRRNILPPSPHEHVVTFLRQFRLNEIAKRTKAAKREDKRIAA